MACLKLWPNLCRGWLDNNRHSSMYIIYILEIFIQSVTVGHSEEKKSEFSKRGDLILATIVQMLQHQATWDLWELVPQNQVHVSNIPQAARSGMSTCAHVHDRNGMVNYKPGEYTREMLFSQKHRQLRRKKLLSH